jgi:hypothetical protein
MGNAQTGRSFFVAAQEYEHVGHSNTHYDLLDALKETGCPVCRLVLRTVSHYIDSVNYEFVNDPGFRSEVEPAWGFCNVHAQQWLQHAHPLGTALIYDAVLGRISAELKRVHLEDGFLASVSSLFGPGKGRAGDAAHGDLRPDGQCPMCRVREQQEGTAVDVIIEGLSEIPFRAAYQSSTGLCLPHLRLALGKATNQEAFTTLRDHAISKNDQLSHQLKEIIRKHDYRFRDEPTGEERGAAERTVRQIAGVPGIDDR